MSYIVFIPWKFFSNSEKINPKSGPKDFYKGNRVLFFLFRSIQSNKNLNPVASHSFISVIHRLAYILTSQGLF